MSSPPSVKKVWGCSLTALLVVAALFAWAALDRTSWEEDFVTEDGGIGKARFTYLEWRYWGHPHIISFGGGTISCAGTFHLDTHRCDWESKRDERVYSVQFRQQRWYAISLDRTHIPEDVVIRFYSGKDGEMLREIGPNEFPLKLAMINLWLTEEEMRVLTEFPAGDYWSRTSLLARTWWKVVSGQDIAEVPQEFIQKTIAQEFPGRASFLPPPVQNR